MVKTKKIYRLIYKTRRGEVISILLDSPYMELLGNKRVEDTSISSFGLFQDRGYYIQINGYCYGEV